MSLEHERNVEAKNEDDRKSVTSHSASSSPTPPNPVDANAAGVARIEALYSVFGGNGAPIWVLYASIALVAYVFSLDENTTGSFLPFATSAFGKHSLIGTISIATTIMGAISKPFIAKIADITSRPRAYVVSLLFYVLGFIVVATSTSVNAVAAGEVLYTIGKTGLDLVTDIIVADLSPLKWRGFATALPASPFIINAFISAEVVQGLLSKSNGWRWGYGIFAIILPVVMTPALIILFWAELKAKRNGSLAIAASPWERRNEGKIGTVTWLSLVKDFSLHIDAFGLILLGVAFALILLPFSLWQTANGHWQNPSIIAMLVVGFVILIAFFIFEALWAPYPLMPRRVINRTFMGALVIDIFYFMSGNMRSLYYSSWVWVVKDWSLRNWTYFTNTLTVGLCVFGLLAGVIQRYTHRYKWLQFSGLCIRIIGMGLTLHARGPNASDAELVWTQILIGLGGAFSVVGSRVASQASVPHEDMAQVIALLSLWTKLGGAVGTAIASSVWTGRMPGFLRKHLPDVAPKTLSSLFGSIKTARTAEPAVRANVILAYNDTMFLLYLPALILSFIPLIAALCMQDFYLGDTQNAVTDTGLAGEKVKEDVNVATNNAHPTAVEEPSSEKV